jgi:hypothetical protein
MPLGRLALTLAAAALIGLAPTRADAPAAPAPPRRIGPSEKVCQLTGDVDWDTGRPTPARTFASGGLDAADLGYPVDHAGKLILFFGDSWPAPHGGGAAGEVPPDDAVAVTERRAPPGKDDGRCLDLAVHHHPAPPGRGRPPVPPRPRFAPATIVGPIPVKQGFFNVPEGGVSVGGALFAFFWTDHCGDPNRLEPVPRNPLAPPPANRGHDCPETEHRNSIGRGVLARSDDEGRTFSHVVPMPVGFVYGAAVNAELFPELPAEQRLGVFVFAAPRYRSSAPYLAYAPVRTFADPASWRFFVGRGPDGQPRWVSQAAWAQGAARPAQWDPPGEPELFAPGPAAERSVGEFSVTWNRPLGRWLMLHGGGQGTPWLAGRHRVVARVARAPWGPWSEPTAILGAEDHLDCHLVMVPDGCGARRDYWPDWHRKTGKFLAGGLYAPYVLNRYTTAAGGGGAPRGSTIYWVVSTWNPYAVVLMRTTLESASPPLPPARAPGAHPQGSTAHP